MPQINLFFDSVIELEKSARRTQVYDQFIASQCAEKNVRELVEKLK